MDGDSKVDWFIVYVCQGNEEGAVFPDFRLTLFSPDYPRYTPALLLKPSTLESPWSAGKSAFDIPDVPRSRMKIKAKEASELQRTCTVLLPDVPGWKQKLKE